MHRFIARRHPYVAQRNQSSVSLIMLQHVHMGSATNRFECWNAALTSTECLHYPEARRTATFRVIVLALIDSSDRASNS